MKANTFLCLSAVFILYINLKAQTAYSANKNFKINIKENFDSIAANESQIRYDRLALFAGSVVAVNAALWVYYNEAWYKGTKTKFHFYDDWYNGNLNVDKLGHLHYAMIQNRLGYRIFRWIGYNDDWSMWLASGLGWLLHLQVELEDAKYAEWGFSWGDLGANTLGAIYPNLQRYLPYLNNFNLKLSYYPSINYRKNIVKHIINDYEGRTYWLTMNIFGLYPKLFKNFIPTWLNIAIGYGGDEIYNEEGRLRQIGKRGIGNQQWYIALDYDLLKIFSPHKNSFLYILLEQLDQIHFPAPAIMITPRREIYLLFISN